MRLRIYHNDTHVVIARNPKDAEIVLRAGTGRDLGDVEPFVLLAEGADLLNLHGRGYRRKTARQIIKEFGNRRGYLHSYEYPQG